MGVTHMVMDTMDTMERERLKLMLNPDIIIMDTATMVDMDIMDTTERGKLLLSLVTIMDMATVTMDTMAREKLRLSLNQDTIIMDMAIMEDMDMDIMEREKLLLNQDTTIMDIATMVDMVIMDTMAKEKLNLVIIIMVMVMDMAMDIMVKQQLFIEFFDLYSFSYVGLIYPPISQLKHTHKKKE